MSGVYLFPSSRMIFTDGPEAVADLYPVIAEGDAVAFLRGIFNFAAVQLTGFGQAINLLGNGGGEIAFGSHSLHRRAEYQTEIFRRSS